MLKDLLARDIRQRIEPVVKVYDRQTLLEDLRQFVITDKTARAMNEFLQQFVASLDLRLRGAKGPDGMAVWLAGFFGSGKSHLAKVLGYLIENPVVDPESGRRAIDVFSVHLDDPTVAHARDLRGALKQVRDKVWCQAIPFEIKSRQDQASPESVTAICLRSFHVSLGLCPTAYLARLERRLQRDGLYDTLLARYEALHGRSWKEDRLEHAYYMDELAVALAEATQKSEASARETIDEYRAHHARVDPEGFAREVLDYLRGIGDEVTPRQPHVLFVVDEMGQFIGDSGDRIEELRAVVEQAGSQGGGRIWFVTTSQEALEQVVGRTGLKLAQLGKLAGRFSVKISLTSEEIRKVVGNRLLKKREAADVQDQLRGLYRKHEGYLAELSNLHTERHLAALDEGAFVASYPFLPHTIPLAQALFDAMRGFKLSGSERSLIGVTQGILGRLADRKPGVLVPLDLVFDQVNEELTAADYLGATGMRAIREADERVAGTPVPASRVLKVLWLITRVTWVPCTAEVIAKLLVDRLGADLTGLRGDVEETLERLRAAGYVGRDEATRQYKYLSEKERTLEEALQEAMAGYGIGVAIRHARELLRDRVLARRSLAEYRVSHGKHGHFDFSLELEGERLSSGGEITVKAYGPLSTAPLDDIERENLAQGTKGRTIWWVAREQTGLVQRLKRAEALEKVPEEPRWKNDRSDETKKLLKDKAKELSDLNRALTSALDRALREGRVFYSGEELDLDGRKDGKTLLAEVVQTVAGHLYSRFPTGDKDFDEASIPRLLQSSTRGLAQLNPELSLFDSEDHLNQHAALVQAISEELRRREDADEDVAGKALEDHFGAIPYGWPPALVRLVLAAMLRGGAVVLEPGGSSSRVYDYTEQGVEAVFTGVRRFQKATFVPTSGGLTPTEVDQAVTALVEMDETGVQESANAITACLRHKAEHLLRAAEGARQKVRDTKLPLPDTYEQGEPVTAAVTREQNPVEAVRRFLEDRDRWAEVDAFLGSYEEFVADGSDRRWRDMHDLVEVARGTPGLADGDEGEAAAAALVDLAAIVSTGELIPKWKEYQERYAVVQARYRELYAAAQERAVAAARQLEEEVTSSKPFLELEDARADAVKAGWFGDGAALHLPPAELRTTRELLDATATRRIGELDSLALAVPGHRSAMFQRINRELEEQRAAEGGREGGPQVHVVDLRARLSGRRFSSAEEFRTFWEDLGKEIEAKLLDRIDVLLD